MALWFRLGLAIGAVPIL